MNLLLLSETESRVVEFRNLSEYDFDSLWDEIARSCELANGTWDSGCIHLRVSDKTLEELRRLESVYAQKDIAIKQIFGMAGKVKSGHFLYLINQKKIELWKLMAARAVIISGLYGSHNWKPIHNEIADTWIRMELEFDIFPFGVRGVKEFIGEKDKSKRVCRFCHLPNRPYGGIGHATPDSLGNKLIFCYEECDICNGKCAKLEQQFIQLMDFRRAMNSIERKKGKESVINIVKGVNYTIKGDDNNEPVLYIKKSTKPVEITQDGTNVYKFDHTFPVVDQDIYRALAKMVINVVPSDRLVHFSRTVDWIMKDIPGVIPGPLPPVMFGLIAPDIMLNQPELYLFFRKNEADNIPYCTAVLLLTDVAYMFVMPYCALDGDRYQYADQVEDVYHKISRYFRIKWEPQQFFSWWESNIWNYWAVDPGTIKVEIRDDGDSVFQDIKIYTAEEHHLFNNNIFEGGDVILKSNSIDYPEELVDSIRKCRKSIAVSIEPEASQLDLYFNEETCKAYFCFRLKFDDKEYLIMIKAQFTVRNLTRLCKESRYITGESFSSLAYILWRKCTAIFDRSLSLKLHQHKLDLLKAVNASELIRSLKYNFIMPKGFVIKTDYRALVE